MWANTLNIGDDFQTLDAINLLKKIIFMIMN